MEECKHSLHKLCLLPYLQLKVKEAATSSMTCPFGECRTFMSEASLRRVLPKEDLQQYYKFSAFSFVERMIQRDHWKVCTEPECREIMVMVALEPGVAHPSKNLLQCSKTGKKYLSFDSGSARNA